jgi:signal transduction histidine kinase
MVKQIVESAGGKIWFESELNVGTEFYIELPIAE